MPKLILMVLISVKASEIHTNFIRLLLIARNSCIVLKNCFIARTLTEMAARLKDKSCQKNRLALVDGCCAAFFSNPANQRG
jgi:hypothetical protein